MCTTNQVRCSVVELCRSARLNACALFIHLFAFEYAGNEICGQAASSARTALGAVVRCVPPPAASGGAPAFPLATALSEAKPSSSVEAWQQAQSQLLSSLRISVATELCADADTMAAFAAPLMTAEESAEFGRSDVAGDGDGDTDAVLDVMLACCAASPAFCDRAAAVDLHEVRP